MNQTQTSDCKKCGAEIDFSSVYCGACVATMNAAQDARNDVPCTRCQRAIRRGMVYCNDCVADLNYERRQKVDALLSAPQFTRPQEAREIEARARARDLGVRVTVLSPATAYRTRSQSDPGAVYTIQRSATGWYCTCPGWVYTGCCKHLGQVERRSEREGWLFGRIAPRPVA